MTNKQIYTAYSEVYNYKDVDAYVSDLTLSTVFLDPDNPDQEPDPELMRQLNRLWHIANVPFSTLLTFLNLSQKECSERFCIPYRTVQDWHSGKREIKPYIRLMMAEACGFVKIRD